MKKQNLHTFPLEATFLRKIQASVQYSSENHYTNFNDNSLEIITFNDSPENMFWPTDSMFEKILRTLSLHNTKYLTKLSISIKASFLFKTSTLRHFGRTLASQFKALKQLDLRFLSCKKLNGENMRNLLDSMTKGMGHLAEVNLHFLACPDIGDQCLEDIKLFVMKRCKKLQRFKVIISGDVLNMSGDGFAYFESDIDQRLQNSNTLSEFYGTAPQNQITGKGGASLCQGIARYLKKLRSLTFKMAPVQIENERNLARNIWKMISGSKKLEYLNFSSSDDINIDDEYLAKLATCIGKNLKNLKSLSLDFPYKNEITERGYQQLAQDFFSMLPSQLTYFALSFEGDQWDSFITDDIVKEIGFNIAKYLKNLQTLILNFHQIEHLTGQALLGLAEAISKGLPTLKKLVLSFAWCEGVNQSFPIILPEQIQQFDLYLYHPQFLVDETWKNLNRLSLSFDECQAKESFLDIFSKPSLPLKNLNELKLIYSQSKKIGDEEIRNLASAIGTNLENLTSLELGFSGCPLLTSDSLLLLGDKICRKLKKLRHLNFSFFHALEDSGRPFVEGAIIYLIIPITSKLKNLESLTLSFPGSLDEKLDLKEVLDELCSLISRNLKKLKKLTLMFDLFRDLEELKREIRERLCHIPMLYIH